MSRIGLHNKELNHIWLCEKKFRRSFLWGGAAIFTLFSILVVPGSAVDIYGIGVRYAHVAPVIIFFILVGFVFFRMEYNRENDLLEEYKKFSLLMIEDEKLASVSSIDELIASACYVSKRNFLVEALLEENISTLEKIKVEIKKDSLYKQLASEIGSFNKFCEANILAHKNAVPLVKVKNEVRASLSFLKGKRNDLQQEWETAYEKFSWWNKMKYSDGPDFSEMNDTINELEDIYLAITEKHEKDFKKIDFYFDSLKMKAVARVAEAEKIIDKYIFEFGYKAGLESGILRKAMWFSAFSLPMSVWADFDRAGDVYDALRTVNGNYAEMSDVEIWWETIFLPPESLAGLAGLAKGAYFEQLVAADTGGQLFENFNHPDTDIVIDGVAYQLKATTSESYVNSVAESFPVVATSEVALSTDAIDSGYTEEELSNTIDQALGGTVADVGDTTIDAILTGVGALGFFATLEGINHAAKKHENGGDGVEAIFEGAGVAIEGTARALVGTAEMGYKVLSSRPIRFVGRLFIKAIYKLGNKIM